MGISWQLFWVAAGLSFVVVGALEIFVANSVRRHARWAYMLAFVLGLIGSVPRLANLEAIEQLPEGLGRTLLLIAPWVYVAMGLSAAVLLVASFIRREAARSLAAATEPTER